MRLREDNKPVYSVVGKVVGRESVRKLSCTCVRERERLVYVGERYGCSVTQWKENEKEAKS